MVEMRVYDEEDAGAAYLDRKPYRAACNVLICPRTQTAFVEALHGEVTIPDVREGLETIYSVYKIGRVTWERADGRKLAKRRIGPKRWVDYEIQNG